MIDPNKTYRTRDGRPVRIYATDGGPSKPIHGAFLSNGDYDGDYEWRLASWYWNGFAVAPDYESGGDLCEITLADELTKQVPWEVLRPEIEWVAMNNDGIWFGYTNQPGTSQESRYWCPAINTLEWPLEAVNMPRIERHLWRKTICKRPGRTYEYPNNG